MRWPWSKPEKRSTAQGYTASLTAALETGAFEGVGDNAPLATAALEMAAGLYARCMAAAMVKSSTAVQAALTSDVLALIARNLIRRGEDHHRIYVRSGRLVLSPVGFAYAHGNSPDPLAWHYSATMYGPTDSRHETVPGAAMLHCRYSIDSSRPWLGVPPWSWASQTGKGIAALERRIANEASAPHGHLLGVPESPEIDEDGEIRPLDAFRNDLATARGRTLVVESPEQNERIQRTNFERETYGLAAEHVDTLRTATGRDVLGSCGVPPSLFVANSDGTAQRESFRRFLHSGLRPVARLVERELVLKLDTAVELDLSDINAADVAGRARAFGAFVKAGLDPQDAAANTGVQITRPVRTGEGTNANE